MSRFWLKIIAAGWCAAALNGANGQDIAPQFTADPAAAAAASVSAAPKMVKNGFACGDKSIVFNDDGSLQLQAGGKKIGSFWFAFTSDYASWLPYNHNECINGKLTSDEKNQTVTFSLDYPAAKKNDGKPVYAHFVMTLGLQSDGLIRMQYAMTANAGELSKPLRGGALQLDCPMVLLMGKQFSIDGKPGRFTAEGEKTPLELASNKSDACRMIYSQFCKEIIIGGDDPALWFRVLIQPQGWVSLFECWNKDIKPFAELRFQPDTDNSRTLLWDLRQVSAAAQVKSPDTHAGIDFWKNDRLHVPDFSGRKNLVQNPSFEGGTRYFTPVPNNADGRSRNYYPLHTIDDQVAFSGRRSLKIRAVKELGVYPAELSTFAIPVEAGKTYTFSCRAKASADHGLALAASSTTGKWPVMFGLGQYPLNTEWQLVRHSFTAPNNALKLELRGVCRADAAGAEGFVWVDDVQLEEGTEATAFSCRPFEAELLSADPDNFLTPDIRPDLRLRIAAKPGVKGSVELTLSDYFYQELWKKKFDFTVGSDGQAVIPLELRQLPRGVMVMEGDFTLADGTKGRDWFRLSVMDKLQNKHRLKNIFATMFWVGTPLFEKILGRFRDTGFGSTTYLDQERDVFDKVRSYGMEPLGNEIFSPRKADGCIEADGKILVPGLLKVTTVTPELEKQVEEAAYQRARSLPWTSRWFFSCENRLIFHNLLPHNPKAFSRLLIASFRGVKKFNPKAEVLVDGGPANMMPANGIQELESYIEAVGGEVVFDGTACHPYRASPEEPDLDGDACQFFAMLDRHGYGGKPVYWNEGIYYSPLSIPEWNLQVTAGYDHWRVGTPSYHMSWSERLSAAWYARSWLVAMKYQDKVKEFNGWSFWFFIDNNLTPLALQKVPNTLGRLLGNAYFKEDIRFAPGVRCYLFEDEQQRPVAALWSHIPKADMGIEPCPEAEFRFGGNMPEIFDLMETERHPEVKDGVCRLPVPQAPMFLRGRPGTLKQLSAAINAATLAGKNFSPVEIAVKPANTRELELTCKNLLSRPFAGTLVLPGDQRRKLTIPGSSSVTLVMQAPVTLPYDRIAEIKYPVTLLTDDGREFKPDTTFRGFAVAKRKTPIVIDGNLDDWNGIAPVAITNIAPRQSPLPQLQEKGLAPFSASYMMTWDNDYLYLAVRVVADKLIHEPRSIEARWNNDCVQFFLDTLADARAKTTKGFDGNDYNYDLFPNPDDSLTVFRRYAPEQQQAGGLNAPKANTIATEVKSGFRRTANGYDYEIAIPAASVAPLLLNSGSVAGVALIINKVGRKVLRDSLTTTPPDTQPFMRPDLYPVMLLTE